MNKFTKITIVWLIGFSFHLSVNASGFQKLEYKISPQPTKIINDIERRKTPSTIVEWSNKLTKNSEGNYFYSIEIPIAFTYFGVGIKTDNLSDIQINYRIKLENNQWTSWRSSEFEITSKEAPNGYFWSEIIFTPDGLTHNEIEIIIETPKSTQITNSRIDLVNIQQNKKTINASNFSLKSSDCPAFPTVIPRSVWLDPYFFQPPYTSTITHPTHVVMHHGASPDAYTDGAVVVRSYWDYHVNSNGWSDIGYNYLVDKFGNIYQGRQNSDMIGQDVNGAHAGSSNPYSIGVNFLGNADIIIPTVEQLNSLHHLLGWWFNSRGYDPTSSEIIVLQSGGSATLPRICGHKDVNIGGTTCPGTILYSQLSSIRTNTKIVIDDCINQAPINLQVLVNNINKSVAFSWQNSGTGWYIAVSETPNFANFYWKFVSGLTSYTGPSGFVDHTDGSTPLILIDNTTYYWRIWDGTSNTNGPNFILTNGSEINNPIKPQINIHPNPFSDNIQINLNLELGDNASLKLFDLLGKQLLNIPIAKTDNYIKINNLNNLSKGFYIVTISSEEETITTKLVKE